MRTALGATGSPGMAYHAISAIETALWDLMGKSTGLPAHPILGGKYRERVRIYADQSHFRMVILAGMISDLTNCIFAPDYVEGVVGRAHERAA